MTNRPLKSRIVSGVLWLGISKGLGQLIAWSLTIVVVRLLAPQDYGLMGIAVVFSGFLLLFNELGLGAAVIQRPELHDRELSDLLWATVSINVSLYAVMLVAAPFVAVYFAEPSVSAVIRVLGLGFVFQGIGLPSTFMLQRRMLFAEKAKAELVGSLAGGFTTLGSALAGLGVWSLVAGYLAQQIATNALYVFYFPVRPSRRFTPGNVRQLVDFGLKVAAGRVCWYLTSNTDYIVVGRVLGTLQLGYYSLAFQFASIPIDKILSIVTQVAFPSFCAVQDDDVTLRRYFQRMVNLVALVTFPMFVGLFLVADTAIPLFLTEKWLPAILPLKILCLASCLRAVGTMSQPLLVAKGRAGVFLANNIFQALAMPFVFWFGARMGVAGVAWTWLLAWPLFNAVLTVQTLNLIGLGVWAYLQAVTQATLGCLAMVGTVRLAQATVLHGVSPRVELAVICVLGAATYAAYQLVFSRTELEDCLALLTPRGRAAVRPAPPSRTISPPVTGFAIPVDSVSPSESE